MSWQYINPVKISFTDSFLLELIKIKNIYSNHIIVILTYDWFVDTEYFVKLKKNLGSFSTFTDIEENPSFSSCNNAIEKIKKLNPNIIIAIGGGSVIDTAKFVRASLYKDKKNVIDIIKSKQIEKTPPVLIAIPTTHGTGSEVTMWATIWDKKNKIKQSLSEYENYPNHAIYDVNLVKTLPVSISLNTTLDALSHAFESIWNKNANPISTNYAIKAIVIIINNLKHIIEPIEIETRKNLLLASMYAGLAFSNTKTAAAHSISYPFSANYKIPHGIACSMPLIPLLKINKKMIGDELQLILDSLNLASIDELESKIQSGVRGKTKFKLRDFGVKRKDLVSLLDKCFTKGRMDNNIVDLKKNDVFNILEEIY